VWQSADPALPAYLSGEPNGGVFNPGNLAMYTYAMGSPVRFKDPNGLSPENTNPASEQSGGLPEGGVAFRQYSGEMQGSLGGDPVTMTWENTLLSLEANWQNEDKTGPGVEGSFAKAAGQATWGNKMAGVYGRYEATVIKGEARACLNIPEAQLGVESSLSAAQAEVAFGVNFFGLSAGVKGEAALGVLAEAEVGAEGVKVGLGPAGVGVEFGLAKGEGENPLSRFANFAQTLKDTEQAIGEYLTTVQMPDFTRVSLREMRDNDGD
jgi:hypothetical protein